MNQYPIPVIPSDAQIKTNTQIAIDYYHLGAVNPMAANEPFWAKMAKMFRVTTPEVKRIRCANCEYYDNTPEMMQAMEAIPLNEFDLFDGQVQRGYCHRLEFICHTSRLCSVWERKDYENEDMGDMENAT